MIRNLGPVELTIMLAIVLIPFGIGRVGKIGQELGTAVSVFRGSINEEWEEAPAEGRAR
jgi:Sec-independent protein translocase protein TatA